MYEASISAFKASNSRYVHLYRTLRPIVIFVLMQLFLPPPTQSTAPRSAISAKSKHIKLC
ncbi:hypothetical protein M422DRAFT_23399 [Sphaerobolus stellatus SS14]|nr:hypothetical protein M422DRAFT_23399 [Sphaerobolus stellatus SS14]